MRQRIDLPRLGVIENLQSLKELGFIFKDEIFTDEGILISCTLPEGWKLIGKKERLPKFLTYRGKKRAEINITTDTQELIIFWYNCYQLREVIVRGAFLNENFDYRLKIVIDGPNTQGFVSKTVDTTYEQTVRDKNLKPLVERAIAWLDKNRPDWKNPFAYWE